MVTIQINISMDELLSSSTSTPRKNKKGGAPISPVVTGGGLGNRSKHGGPANHGQGVVKGALVRISASCWRGGANLARRGRGAMEERGGGAQLQLQDVQAWRKKLSRSITFTFPEFEVFFVCDFESIVSA